MGDVPRRRSQRWAERAAAVLILAGLSALTGCGSSGDDAIDPAAVYESVERGAAATSLAMTQEQVGCYSASLIKQFGLDGLAEAGVPELDPFSPVVVRRLTTTLSDAARYFTPLFTCLDMDPVVRASVTDLPPAVQDCVVEAVLADREVRVAYVLGTPDGSTPSEEVQRMTDPLIERSSEIEADCLAGS